jgi:hypothetical protein
MAYLRPIAAQASSIGKRSRSQDDNDDNAKRQKLHESTPQIAGGLSTQANLS